MRLYFDSHARGGCLTIIFVGSFPYFKFLTKTNSQVRRKQPAKDWPVAGCFGRLPALNDSTVQNKKCTSKSNMREKQEKTCKRKRKLAPCGCV